MRCLLELGRTAESERWLRLFRDRFPEQARCQACLRLDKDIRAAADKEKEEGARPGSQGQAASASSNSDNSSGGSSSSNSSGAPRGLHHGPEYFRRHGGGEDAGQPEEVEPDEGESLEAEEDVSRPFVSEHGLRISSQV